MADSAVTRTSRALDLIPFIVKHPGVSIAELAQAFSTTEYEISETLEIVFMCGLPGYTPLELIDLSKDDGFVSIIDPQNLNRPRNLQQLEAVSILLGLANLKSQGVSSEVLKVIENVEGKLGKLIVNPEILNSVDQPAHIPGGEWRSDIESSIRARECIEIDYTSIGKDQRSERRVWPQRIYTLGGKLYFEALTEEGLVRHFRFDRIHDLKLHPEKFSGHIAGALSDEFALEVLIPRTAQYFLESNSHIIESIENIGDICKVVLRISHSDWIIRALSAIDGSVAIISPQKIADDFALFAEATMANYMERA